ncbi:MAG: tetratricopeptide repeat protein [Rhodobacteraceae bacterium]|nr:tetratricopeptide repeat protein [Paracoccaceae bacterium]
MASCAPRAISNTKGGPYAPGLDRSKGTVDNIEVAHRLMEAGQYELALSSFTRAALDDGLSGEILNGMGTANLGLGRLGQSEELLRRAVKEEPDWAEAWNNLGVLLLERDELSEATQVLRKAYALDDGQNDSIRDNLRLALAKMENADNNTGQEEEYKLVRRGSSDYLIRKTP